MANSVATIDYWNISPGVEPATDQTAFATSSWTFSDKIRFYNGLPQKIGGWLSVAFNSGQAVTGVPRSLWSTQLNGQVYTLIGTNTRLYCLIGSTLTNITPFVSTSTAASNSLSTNYDTLAANPISTVNGSSIVTIQDPKASLFQVGDQVTISGATAVGGVTSLNAVHAIMTVGATSYTITAAPATSTATGGGSAVVRAIGLVRVTVANTLSPGDRIKIQNAATYIATSATVSAPGTGYTPSDILTLTGGTGTASTFTVSTTQVVSATISVAGTGGTTGTQTVTGTTGTGTKFQASVTVTGGAITAVNSITVAGSYTANPTLISSEPVTGGGLTGAKLSVVMGVLSVAVTTAGSYTVQPTNPVSTTDSTTGTGATLTVTYSGSGNVGGITAAQLNNEYIVRNLTSAHFDIYTTGVPTSSVTAAGGTAIVFYAPLPAGLIDEQFGQGYGAGLYGVGLYGTALISSTGRQYPQIWYFDRYGSYILMSPGNGGMLYEWLGSLTTAPVQTANSPNAINYFFVSDDSIVTFGNAGIENRITASDVDGRTVWTATAQNQVYDGPVQNAGRLISHISVQGLNLIFTENQTYTFRYIGLPNVWELKLLGEVGIISSLAGQEVNGSAYWQGLDNFYGWGGGNISVMPSVTGTTSTILNYVFGNLNFAQKSKCFSWYYKAKQELRWHYPNSSSGDPNAMAVVSIADGTWWPDTITRTAAEQPTALLTSPRLIDYTGNLYNHEYGTDANGSPLTWTLSTNVKSPTKNETMVSAFIPDSYQLGPINVELTAFQWPQSVATPLTALNYTVNPTDGRQNIQQNGRFLQYTLSGSYLGQYWQMGKWANEIQPTGNGK